MIDDDHVTSLLGITTNTENDETDAVHRYAKKIARLSAAKLGTHLFAHGAALGEAAVHAARWGQAWRGVGPAARTWLGWLTTTTGYQLTDAEQRLRDQLGADNGDEDDDT